VHLPVRDHAADPHEKDSQQDDVEKSRRKANVDRQGSKGEQADHGNEAEQAKDDVPQHEVAEREGDQDGSPVQAARHAEHCADGQRDRQADGHGSRNAYGRAAVQEGAFECLAGGCKHGGHAPGSGRRSKNSTSAAAAPRHECRLPVSQVRCPSKRDGGTDRPAVYTGGIRTAAR